MCSVFIKNLGSRNVHVKLIEAEKQDGSRGEMILETNLVKSLNIVSCAFSTKCLCESVPLEL